MADDPHKKGAADRDRINIHEDYEVEYWTKRLHVNREKLKQAVGKVGVMVKDVEAELAR